MAINIYKNGDFKENAFKKVILENSDRLMIVVEINANSIRNQCEVLQRIMWTCWYPSLT